MNKWLYQQALFRGITPFIGKAGDSVDIIQDSLLSKGRLFTNSKSASDNDLEELFNKTQKPEH